MAAEGTLIATTRTGVRPLGVRGAPLHNAASQLRRVVRRRLGDGPADLLADPWPHDDGSAIDWYASWAGEVSSLADADPETRAKALAEIDKGLAEIDQLGETLSDAGDPENVGLVAKSLRMAARRPPDSFLYLVGGRPVIVAWGYETESMPTLMPTAVAAVPPPPPPPPAPPPPAAPHVSVLEPRPLLPAVLAPPAAIPWARTLAFALPLLLLLMGGSWLLRGCIPADPALNVATQEPPPGLPPGPPPGPAPPDPLPLLKASLSSEQAREQALQREIAAIDAELRKRVAECKPPEPPKPPPQVAAVAPPPDPKPAPAPPPVQAAPRPAPAPAPPPPPQQSRPRDDKLRLPTAPTNNYAFMQGCWRTDPFQHERGYAPGVSTYCFDGNGNGQLEWRRGRTACRTSAQARFEGSTLRLRDRDTTCNDRSQWYADQLVCQRGADDVAVCSGRSQGGTFGGPVSWTVNLHKLY